MKSRACKSGVLVTDSMSAMYSQSSASMAPPQKPETFMLSDAAQQSLPQDAQVALQQVDNREYFYCNRFSFNVKFSQPASAHDRIPWWIVANRAAQLNTF